MGVYEPPEKKVAHTGLALKKVPHLFGKADSLHLIRTQFFNLKLKISVPADSSEPLLNLTKRALRMAIAFRLASAVVEPLA